MKPLLITAHLANGYAASDPWSPSIDSILAYWHLKKNLSPDDFAAGCAGITKRVIDDLPLGIERYGDNWWYQCSIPQHEKIAEHQAFFNRRFDVLQAEKHLYEKRPKNLQLAAGALKNKRTKVAKILSKTISWHIIGDEIPIMALLQNCTHIGAQTSRGYGEVVRWECGEGDIEQARFNRALPELFADEHGIRGIRLDWGFRPNVRDADNQTRCVLPRYRG